MFFLKKEKKKKRHNREQKEKLNLSLGPIASVTLFSEFLLLYLSRLHFNPPTPHTLTGHCNVPLFGKTKQPTAESER